MEKVFRYSIKAIIIQDGKLLVESCDYGRGRFCKLPGGGHQWGETMTEALIRECKEELCLDIIPNRLVMVRDYIAKNHHQHIDLDCFHQAELMFECSVKDFSLIPSTKKQFLNRIIETDAQLAEVLGTMFPHNRNAQVEKLAKCRFGGLNFQPDYCGVTHSQNHDIIDCSIRSTCPGSGIVCKNLKYQEEELTL